MVVNSSVVRRKHGNLVQIVPAVFFVFAKLSSGHDTFIAIKSVALTFLLKRF